MRLQASAQVRWLKGFYGFSEPPPGSPDMVAVNPRVRGAERALAAMGRDLSDTPHALAVYITQNAPKTSYYNGRSIPGSVAGLMWLARLPAGSTPSAHAEDQHYKAGWPVAGTLRHQGPLLATLLSRCYGVHSGGIEQRLRSYFQRSVPVPVYELFPDLANELTAIYRAVVR